MQRHEKTTFSVAAVFFNQYLLETEVFDARAAVLFIGPDHQIALLTRLAERFAIDESLLAPSLGVRTDLSLKKTSCGFAKLIVLGFEDSAVHGTSLWR